MFERRIKLLLVLLSLPAMAVCMRLFQLQVVQAADQRQAAEDMLKLRPRTLPCLRGRILDSKGRTLAHDAPSWDISVRYGAMVDDPEALKRMCRRLGLPWREAADLRKVQDNIRESWDKIAQLTATPLADLHSEAQRVINLVQRIKKHVSESRGMEIVIEEELQTHPVVHGLDNTQQVAARVALAEYPWIEISSGHRRVYAGKAAIGQILGKLGRITPEALAKDPNVDDDLARYQPDDLFGVLGVERMAEQWLRGRRGQIHHNRVGEQIQDPVKAQDGRDAHITIDLALQEAIYGIWTRSRMGMGGAAVILDIPTRNVLAMVSYPGVDPNDPDDIRRVQPDDPRRPFLFRTVRGNYHPGSIVKPMILAAGMTERKITRNETVNCMGKLFSQTPGWGCEGIHHNISAVGAVQRSCNVYFYRLGQQLGVDLIARWMQMFGMGQLSGMGLAEEFPGHLPVTRNDGQARHAAIGQSETEITPIQAANLTATLADGRSRPVTLWANNPQPHSPSRPLPVSDHVWETVREGMYAAVNLDHGTAYRHIHVKFDPYVLLGKTGSAETGPAEWFYPVIYPDGSREEIRAFNARAAREKAIEIARKRHPDATIKPADIKIDDVHKRVPPEYSQTHSWFVGYLAPRGRHLQPVEPGPASVAIAVIVEYAGHGGEVAAPMAAEMLESYLMLQDHYARQGQAGGQQ